MYKSLRKQYLKIFRTCLFKVYVYIIFSGCCQNWIERKYSFSNTNNCKYRKVLASQQDLRYQHLPDLTSS